MTSAADRSDPFRPPVRRLGRRRVVTSDAPGVVPREDPTADDRVEDGAHAGEARRERDVARGDGPASRAARGGANDPDTDAVRDRWLRAQRPPHWG